MFYNINDVNYSIGLETGVLYGLNPGKWLKENLFDVLLIRLLLRSGRDDITIFETILCKKIILENYRVDMFEFGIYSKIKNSLILFPILVDNHYIVLAYKEENDKGQIMEFDSMNHVHPLDYLVTTIQRIKSFIVAKKRLCGKAITFKPSVRILCPRQTNYYDCAFYALKNCEWLINNMYTDTSAEFISSNMSKYNEKDTLKDRKIIKDETETLFHIADVDCNLENEYPVSCLDDTELVSGIRYFLVCWMSTENSKDQTWEKMSNLFCPLLIIEYFRSRNMPLPTDVESYLNNFTDQIKNVNEKGFYIGYNIQKIHRKQYTKNIPRYYSPGTL